MLFLKITKTKFRIDDCNRVGNVTLSWLEDLSLGDGIDKNKRMCIDAEMATNPVAGLPKCIGYWQCHKMHGPQLFKYNQKTMVSKINYSRLSNLVTSNLVTIHRKTGMDECNLISI